MESNVKGYSSPFGWLANIFRRPLGGGEIPTPAPADGSGTKTRLPPAVWTARAQSGDPVIVDRITSTKNHLRVFNNDIKELLSDRLRAGFHPENYARLKLTLHSSTNPLLRIVEDMSVLYSSPAKRYLEEEQKKEKPVEDKPIDGATASADQTKEPPPDAPPPPEDVPPKDKAAADNPDQPVPPKKDAPPFGKKAGAVPDKAGVAPSADSASALNTGDPQVDALAEVLDLSGIDGPDVETPFDKLMKAYDWDVLLDQVEKLCGVCPVVWVRPFIVYDKRDEKTGVPENDSARLTYIIYTPDQADVVTEPEDPTTAKAWWYNGEETVYENGQHKIKPVIHFFTPDWYVKMDAEWREMLREPNELDGMLPVVEFRLDLPTSCYYVDGRGKDLFDATIEVCLLKTIQNQRAKDSGFKQLAISADPKDVPADQVMGGPAPVYLGDDGTATVLDLQPALDQHTNLWKERERALANRYGISESSYDNSSIPQSGFAKKLDQAKILSESKRRRKFFAKSEQKLYTVTAQLLKARPVKTIPNLDPAMTLKTDFAEPTFEEVPKEQAEVDALELKFNAISIVDILRRKNPDLNDVELIQMAHRNMRINQVFMTEDQSRLVDILASGAIAGASLDAGGGGGGDPFGGGGGPPPPGGEPPKALPPGGGGKPPPFGGK